MTMLLITLAVIVSLAFIHDCLDLRAWNQADELTQLDMGEKPMPHRMAVWAILFWALAALISYL